MVIIGLGRIGQQVAKVRHDLRQPLVVDADRGQPIVKYGIDRLSKQPIEAL